MRQHLIVDADDTLWENNIYFERAFDEFIDFLGHSSLGPREVRAILDEIETANAKIHGSTTAPWRPCENGSLRRPYATAYRQTWTW